MQPVIGITMCIDENSVIGRDTDHNYVRREYGEAVRDAGGRPIFIDPSLDPLMAARLCDGIVISGGEDIDPALYGQGVVGIDVQEPRRRTDWERQLIDACDEWGRPVLGICYGEQLLNVHYGGDVYQDISTDYGATLDHGTSDAAAHHEVVFEQDFLGYKAGDRVVVAARHHQAIRALAEGFSVVARSADGVIEAVAGKGHYGVQWHAECDATAGYIYGEFVRQCADRARQAKAVTGIRIGSKHLAKFLPRFR